MSRNTPRTIKAAVFQYKIRKLASFEGFAEHLEKAVQSAADRQADLVVLPEYFACELLSLVSADLPLKAQIRAVADFKSRITEVLSRLAAAHRIYICAGTMPALGEGGQLTNDSLLVAPSGALQTQSKIFMTRFEDEHWGVVGGTDLKVIDIGKAKVAILTCYAAEFPELARRAAAAGAEVLLVPSCTEARTGWFRVRGCAAARAIENQVYVLQSSLVGAIPEYEAVAEHYGLSSILTPSDAGFPKDGILAEAPANEEALIVADLDLDLLAKVRADGAVFTYKHGLTAEAKSPRAQLVKLS